MKIKEFLFYRIIPVTLFFMCLSSACKKDPPVIEDPPGLLPDSALFAKEHPSPEIVRGFMIRETFTQKDCDDARAFGANVIRIQIFPARYATNKNLNIWDAWPSFLDRLESQVLYAKQAGLKVVIDLHQPPFQNAGDFEQAEFWNRTDLEEPFCRVWRDISTRMLPYKDVVWGYDILNEPLDRSQLPAVTRQWKPLAIKIIEAIREIDTVSWIIFEPGPGSLFSGFKGLTPINDLHIIYSSHFYYPQDFTHQGVYIPKGTSLADGMNKINFLYPSVISGTFWDKMIMELMLKDADAFSARWKVPVYVGEFSVIRWAPKEDAVRWLQDLVDLLEARNWSWSYHAFREWNGWSLEHDEQLWIEGLPLPKAVTYDTDRAKIIKSAFLKNTF